MLCETWLLVGVLVGSEGTNEMKSRAIMQIVVMGLRNEFLALILDGFKQSLLPCLAYDLWQILRFSNVM
ncbi:hypothetical protein A2U01_0094470, partial [Trifolium medium]|nr:hypothetical protein [Trifolium medium]